MFLFVMFMAFMVAQIRCDTPLSDYTDCESCITEGKGVWVVSDDCIEECFQSAQSNVRENIKLSDNCSTYHKCKK